MEYKNVFISLGIVVIAVVGIMGLIGQWNQDYGITAGESFNDTIQHVQQVTGDTLETVGNNAAGDTITEEGAGESDAEQGMIRQALSTIKRIPTLLGLIPSLLNDAASIIGVAGWIVDIGVLLFLIVFSLTFAYILLLGAKRLL